MAEIKAGLPNIRKAVVSIVVFLGAAPRLREFLACRSLWMDEASLALGLMERSFTGLFNVLPHNQSAPVLFLLIVKSATSVLGFSEYALRSVPLLLGLLSIVLFYTLLKKAFLEDTLPFALILFCITPQLVYYSNELKPYMCDIAVLLAYYNYLLHAWDKKDGPNPLGLALISSVIIWLSFPALFAVASAYTMLFLRPWSGRVRGRRALLVSSFLVAGSFAALYFVSLRPNIAFQQPNPHWIPMFLLEGGLAEKLMWLLNAAAFGPVVDFLWDYTDALWLKRTLGVLAVIGAYQLYLKDRRIFGLLALPFAIASLAAMLRRYPLGSRLVLFQAPLFIIFLTGGVTLIREKASGGFAGRMFSGAILALVLLPPLVISSVNFIKPQMKEHLRPVYEYVRSNIAEGDSVYVYYGAAASFSYYSRSGEIENPIYMGEWAGMDNPGLFLGEISEIPIRSGLWVVIAHDGVVSSTGRPESSYILDYLESKGSIARERKYLETLPQHRIIRLARTLIGRDTSAYMPVSKASAYYFSPNGSLH